MKKLLAFLLTVMAAVCLSACGNLNNTKADDKIEIVTTIFPEYDWVKNVLGDNPANAEVTLLLDNGVDLHSYQPTVDDIMKITSADLFIYVGGESDEWVDEVLKQSENKDLVVINLMDELGDAAKEEEIIEGMECEEEEEEGEGEEEVEYDEHVWLSLKDATIFVNSIEAAMETIDSTNASVYKANADAYIDKLNELDKAYEKAVSEAEVKTLLFGDRFPFRYLVDDYGISYYAAFVGCSTETNASFQTVVFLAEKVDELSLKNVMTIEGTNHSIAETIIENTTDKNQKILVMDSMQSVTSKGVEEGITYLSIMESNLEVLKEALDVDTNESVNTSESSDDIDVDLTAISGILVYSEVYNMMATPENYMGKKIKMEGLYAIYFDDTYSTRYDACIVQDATACCATGIEFELSDDLKFPDDYPEEGDLITVEGIFDTYEEGSYTYCTLRNASLLKVEK